MKVLIETLEVLENEMIVLGRVLTARSECKLISVNCFRPH